MKEKLIERLKNFKITPFFVISLSFLIVILVGSILLVLPFAYEEGYSPSYIDALFTATTSTCVTGLVSVVDGIGPTYSLFGRIVTGFLIQIGGLGVTTFAVFFFMVISSKISFNEQTLVKETWNLRSFRGLRKVFFLVLVVTFTIETAGAIILFLDFYYIHSYPLDEAVGYAIFHSVSAFNNAGIDLFGNKSLIPFQNDYLLNITTAILIILGGIGFFVIIDVVSRGFRFNKFNTHTKVVLSYTAFLLVVGTLLIYLCEINNDSHTSFFGAFFMSTSTRTAGFTLYDLSTYRDATIFVMTILMFIGASPGGTGGGIKTATLAVLFAYFRGLVLGKNPTLFRRRMSDDLIKRASLILLLGISVFLCGVFLICIFEGNVNYISATGDKIFEYQEGAIRFSFIDYVFEAMSAFGTVGLTTGFTPYYSIGSKIVLILLMYIGRIGPLSISTVIRRKNMKKFDYVVEDIRIG